MSMKLVSADCQHRIHLGAVSVAFSEDPGYTSDTAYVHYLLSYLNPPYNSFPTVGT